MKEATRRAFENRKSKARWKISLTPDVEVEENSWALTTSIICMSVRPKLSTRASDSLPTGRSSTLYESSRSFSSFFSWRPPLTSPVPNHNQQSVRSCNQLRQSPSSSSPMSHRLASGKMQEVGAG